MIRHHPAQHIDSGNRGIRDARSTGCIRFREVEECIDEFSTILAKHVRNGPPGFVYSRHGLIQQSLPLTIQRVDNELTTLVLRSVPNPIEGFNKEGRISIPEDVNTPNQECLKALRHELTGVRGRGTWRAYREALRLQEEGGASAIVRSLTMFSLATGLQDSGNWPKAELLLRASLRLSEERGDTPISRGVTLHWLARGLRDNGQWSEAEPLFREALRLKEAGGGSPESRSFTLDQLARGLRDNARWTEAEPLFREALRLNEDGKTSIHIKADTLRAFAKGLRQNGANDEADTLLAEAQRLLDVAGS